MAADVLDRVPPVALLDELKAWLRIEDTLEDALLSMELRAATEAVETYLGRRLVEREIEEHGVLAGGRMRLSATPARRLIGAWVKNEDGVDTALADVRFEPGSAGFPAILAPFLGQADVRVRYVAGQVADWNGLPDQLRMAVIRVASHMHAYRDSSGIDVIPGPVRRILSPMRRRRVL